MLSLNNETFVKVFYSMKILSEVLIGVGWKFSELSKWVYFFLSQIFTHVVEREVIGLVCFVFVFLFQTQKLFNIFSRNTNRLITSNFNIHIYQLNLHFQPLFTHSIIHMHKCQVSQSCLQNSLTLKVHKC